MHRADCELQCEYTKDRYQAQPTDIKHSLKQARRTQYTCRSGALILQSRQLKQLFERGKLVLMRNNIETLQPQLVLSGNRVRTIAGLTRQR